MLSNHPDGRFGPRLACDLDSMSKRAWVNPAYSGSPPISPVLNIRTLYNPKANVDNPYDSAPSLGASDPDKTEPKPATSTSRGIRGLWGTTLTENMGGNRERFIKTSIRELLVYLVFLLDLCLLTYGMTSASAYYYTTAMLNLFVNTPSQNGVSFQSITSMSDFWDFSQGPLLDGLYWTKWYNNKPLLTDGNSFIYYDNLLMGVPRMRQLKVRNDSCLIYKDFQEEIMGCYDVYSQDKEDTFPFGLINGTAWQYHTEKEIDGSSHWGLLATYSGGGYYQDMKKTRDDSADVLLELMTNLWLDKGTRAVFIDFSTYNANINLFSVIRLLVEFSASGGAIPSYQIRTVKLIRYVNTWDYFIMGCEVLFCIFILYYMVEEILELRIHRLSYFGSIWNILDMLIIMIGIVLIIFNVFRTVKVNELLEGLLQKPAAYADFEFLAFWQTQYNNMNAVNVFFAWIKVFKYISFNKTMTQLSSTLARCAKDILGFAIMFFIVFFAYAQLGYLLFGNQVETFSTFVKCIFTQFRIILGDFDFDGIDQANRILGPIYFVTFVFFVFFVLLNMFLAIINDTYSEVKEELSKQKNDLQFTDIIKQSYVKTFTKLKLKKEKISDVQKALQTGSKDLEFEEFRESLKEMGHADQEISEAFSKFDRDGNRVLDKEEQNRMKRELEEKRDALSAEINNLGRNYGNNSPILSKDTTEGSAEKVKTVSQQEFHMLVQQVLQLERSVANLASNVDALKGRHKDKEWANISKDDRSSPDGDMEAEELKEEAAALGNNPFSQPDYPGVMDIMSAKKQFNSRM